MPRSSGETTIASRGTWFDAAAIVLALVGCTGLTCTTPNKDVGPRDRAEVEPAARHAIHTAELERVMDEIDRYRRHRWPQEVEAELQSAKLAQSQRAFTRAGELTDSLATAATQITTALEGVELSEADRRAFLAKVDVFEDQISRLRRAVSEYDAERMNQVLREIDTTCTSCHERFRDVSGPLGS